MKARIATAKVWQDFLQQYFPGVVVRESGEHVS